MNGGFLRTWLVPFLVIANLIVVLLFFPFGVGYRTSTEPLGADLWLTWTKTSPGALDFTYCLLVPIIVGYLVFLRGSLLGRAKIQGSSAAIFWILFGLLLFWVGSKSGKQLIGEVGLQIFLLGSVSWFWGNAVLRLLLFPGIFLFFAWPLPFMDSYVAFPLRMLVSFLAYHLLELIGIPCLRDGTALFSAPDPQAGLSLGARFQIDIADPCSGIHSLVPLLMFSALYTYLFVPVRWQQWTIFLSAVPLAVVGNVVRILMLVEGSLTLGEPFAIGTNDTPSWFHEACGYAVFVVVLGSELLLARLISGQSARFSSTTEDSTIRSALDQSTRDVPWWRSGLFLVLSSVMLVVYGFTPTEYLMDEPGVLMQLPDQVILPSQAATPFIGSPAPIFGPERTLLPNDTQFARKNYDDFAGHQIYFSVILGGEHGGLQQFSLHRPEVCLVAQGWHLDKQENLSIALNSGHNLVARSFLIERSLPGVSHTLRAIYLFWFVAEDKATPSYFDVVLWSSWERFLHNRNPHWASVTAMSPITQSLRGDGLNEEQTRSMVQEFIRQMVPVVQKSEMPSNGNE